MDLAYGARIPTRGDAGSALGAFESSRESDSANTGRGPLRHEPRARRTLIQIEEAWLPSGRLRGGFGEIANASQVLDDLSEGSRAATRLHRSRNGFVPPRPPRSMHAARVPGEGGAAMLALVDFEGRQLPASPTKDLRRRAERLRHAIEFSGLRIPTRNGVAQSWSSSHETGRSIAVRAQDPLLKTNLV
jgi:hypothetical protein